MAAPKKNDRALFGGGGKGSEDELTLRRNQDKELANEVDEIEKEMNELRATYELYFMGVEKLEPQAPRDLLKARLRRFQEKKPRNTALRFRVQQLKARMVSLENYWQRTLRQREAGTYHRDVARVKRKEVERMRAEAQAARQSPVPTPPMEPSGVSIPSGDLRAPPPSAGARPAAQRPRVSSSADLTDDKLQKLYKTYITARRRCGESTDLDFGQMASRLRTQVPQLMSKTGAGSVELKVVIKGGKAVLKALPKSD